MKQNSLVRQIVQKLNEHIYKLQEGTYLLRLDLLPDSTSQQFLLSENEEKSRRASFEASTKLPYYQRVPKSVSDRFLKELYPQNNELSQFYTKFKSHNKINHSSLYESYCQLPQPGVAHMRYQDFEVFMKEFSEFRKWVRPNKLLLTNLHLLKKKSMLKLYLKALTVRREHLNALLHITQDMKMAGIPISNNERRCLIYKTFYRDRFDILHHVQTWPRDNYHKRAVLNAINRLPFDMDTFTNLRDSFGESLDIDTLNMFLFTALRHRDKEVSSAVLSAYVPGSYNRDTFKILIENLAFQHGNAYLEYIDLLVTQYPFLIDIRLVNTIMSSLINRHQCEEAESVLAAVLGRGLPNLEPAEMFLKLLSYEDKKSYTQLLRKYDALPSKPFCILQPTPQTFLPFLKFHCEQRTGFSHILDLLLRAENIARLPLTTQMFKYAYQSFARTPCRAEELQYITGRLIEYHDINNMGQDSWSKEIINEGALPEKLVAFLETSRHETPTYNVNGSKFLKLSSELMAVIFEAYKVCLDRQHELRNKVVIIEEDLNKLVAAAVVHNKLQQPVGRNQPIALSKLDEITYMRKMSLLMLFDLDISI